MQQMLCIVAPPDSELKVLLSGAPSRNEVAPNGRFLEGSQRTDGRSAGGVSGTGRLWSPSDTCTVSAQSTWFHGSATR